MRKKLGLVLISNYLFGFAAGLQGDCSFLGWWKVVIMAIGIGFFLLMSMTYLKDIKEVLGIDRPPLDPNQPHMIIEITLEQKDEDKSTKVQADKN